jgi:serine/threonine protein kinase
LFFYTVLLWLLIRTTRVRLRGTYRLSHDPLQLGVSNGLTERRSKMSDRHISTTSNASSTNYHWPTDVKSYELISKIGQGAFATVYRTKCTLRLSTLPKNDCNQSETAVQHKYCAVKILDLEHFDTNLSEIRSEVLAMRLSNHPNVIQFYTCFVHETNLWLVTQLMSKGSSLCCIHAARSVGLLKSGLREEWITFILHETLKGLQYFHENGQIHRDIKAGNILIDASGEVRIADFGVSGWLISGGLRRDHCKTFVGTPCWMAPEVRKQNLLFICHLMFEQHTPYLVCMTFETYT